MDLYGAQKDYFRRAYETGEHGWPTTGPTPFVARAVDMLLKKGYLPRAGRVLDLGCGEGRHAIHLARRGLHTVGLDYQWLALERARKLAGAAAAGAPVWIAGDAVALPFRKQSFDLVIDYGCLHHVKKSDTARYVSGVGALLPPRGHFILSCFSWRFKHHPGERRSRDWMVHRGHYDRFFRKRDLEAIFGPRFTIRALDEERDGTHAFYHALMSRK
jgi:SAM-dependent methyltransferase